MSASEAVDCNGENVLLNIPLEYDRSRCPMMVLPKNAVNCPGTTLVWRGRSGRPGDRWPWTNALTELMSPIPRLQTRNTHIVLKYLDRTNFTVRT